MNARILRLFEKAWFEAQTAQWLWTAPNPRVGAIALKNGQIVGRGCHQLYGGPHAEESALRDARAWDEAAQKAIPGRVDEMVVTLEPCSATGKKRPPCTQAVLDAGIQTLWVGAVDPDPRHAGAGLEVLRAAGVQIEILDATLGETRFAEANHAFLRGLAHAERPWVMAKWAASVDGKLATDSGASQWITNAESRAEVHHLRACSEALLAGAGTLRSDDPSLTARPEQGPAGLRAASAPNNQPIRVLLGGATEVSADAALFQDDSTRVWFIEQGQEPNAAIKQAGDPVHFVDCDSQKRLDLNETLGILRSQYAIRRLFVEGGPTVHGHLLAAECLDAIVRYEAPMLLGGQMAACAGPSVLTPRHSLKLIEEERLDLGSDLRRAFLCTDCPGADS